ncbi:longitudinals lacking protein, isoforms J/P/Q/S/Z isoform X1 [Episyrphus balteatus]|uniref:longitudinals lacking protein, isoforms J/P/Q/S/Z isoform X1 n=1 Tax=Episyrphus balteatus TaxID=286459 RepID=UPI0024860557|nr:longitudinals lacking protein, isoforms J/P/Q/S/Z isoform X1 [Episyrphus balteatus]
MDDDQQFCLRWNNHQSTLISVFDTLLENETLVDCTLAAEGKFLKAHKVVLSACSPYFATLLSEQYDKHPIFILKDVKYQELRAMMDYMYRGEVNISQDQLAALLKAAESLQIKGLSDNRTGSGNSSSGLGVGGSQQQQQQKISAEQQQHKHISVPGKLMTGSASAGYTLEQTKRSRIGPSSIDSQDLSGSREGSSSPTSRRRKKVRRRSIENVLADNHDNSNSSQVIQAGTSLVPTTNATGTITAMLPMVGSGVAGTTTTIAGTIASTVSAVTSSLQQQHQQQQTSAASAAANIITANVTKKTESVKMGGNTDAMNAAVTSIENIQDENAADSIDEKEMLMKEKQNHKRPKHHHEGGVVATSTGKDEIVIEPKSEYDDEGNDETVEDLTLDDEEMGLEDLDHNAGPSHGGEGSSQGYAQWQVDRSQDEVYMAAQEAQQRDPQENVAPVADAITTTTTTQNDTNNSSSNQKSAQTESRIRVRNWLMLADQSILQKSILTNSTNQTTTTTTTKEQETPEPEPEPAAPEPKRKRVTRLSTNATNKTNNNNKSISDDIVKPKTTTTSTSTSTGANGGTVKIAIGNSNATVNIGVGKSNNVTTTTTNTTTNTGDGNSTYDGVDDNTTEVIVKFERSSSSCDESENDDPFNYDLKLSSPMSWAFDSVKIEESEFDEGPENEDDEETADADINDCNLADDQEHEHEHEHEHEPDTADDEEMKLLKKESSSNRNSTRRVYGSATKLRSSMKKHLVDSSGLNLPPETTITTTTPNTTTHTGSTMSGNTEICMSSDKKYRILIQNQRMRKESLEHSEDMIYNANIEKPWVCKNCNRNYKWKNSLKCHLKNECGQPPRFFCSKLCGYATNVHSNLKRHLNTKCRDKIGDESDKSENTHYTLVIKKQDAV